jgi:WD repeat-containing protein 26
VPSVALADDNPDKSSTPSTPDHLPAISPPSQSSFPLVSAPSPLPTHPIAPHPAQPVNERLSGPNALKRQRSSSLSSVSSADQADRQKSDHRGRPSHRRSKRRRRIDGAMRIDSEVGNPSQSPPHSFSNGSNGVSPTVSKISNGHAKGKAESNGTSSSPRHSNGTNSVTAFSPTWHGHSREEIARVLIQGLSGLGYHTTARALSRESGYELEGPTVAAFRSAVLEGEWTEAEALLFGDPIDPGGEVGGIGLGKGVESKTNKGIRGLTLVDGANRKEMLFWMRQQKYLELLENRDLGAALLVLRQELTPLHQNTERLHALGGYGMPTIRRWKTANFVQSHHVPISRGPQESGPVGWSPW